MAHSEWAPAGEKWEGIGWLPAAAHTGEEPGPARSGPGKADEKPVVLPSGAVFWHVLLLGRRAEHGDCGCAGARVTLSADWVESFRVLIWEMSCLAQRHLSSRSGRLYQGPRMLKQIVHIQVRRFLAEVVVLITVPAVLRLMDTASWLLWLPRQALQANKVSGRNGS